MLLAVVVAVGGSVWIVPAAQAEGGCSGDGLIPTLYKKVTGNELIHCP